MTEYDVLHKATSKRIVFFPVNSRSLPTMFRLGFQMSAALFAVAWLCALWIPLWISSIAFGSGWKLDTEILESPVPAGSKDEAPKGELEHATSNPAPGHSYHGEVFNEGPRQSAYLMEGMGNVHFPITTHSPMAQRFMDQGVAQLHGFWYFEAERSFRQVAAFDPDCAMAYWGMAMANLQNPSRAKGLIDKASLRKEKASPKEKRLIELLKNRLDDTDPDDSNKRKTAVEAYVKSLEQLIYEYPDDVELMAFLVCSMWENEREDIRVQSPLAVDSIIDKIFAKNPRHPAHHYRIHLWDYTKPERALESSALCGPSLPGIAHMWHMPGHIYSRLHRYNDAVWQQEASARVDHAHMMRDRVLPDQIHNFAHNNEWLIRNLNHVARVRDAVALAMNMIELPRHPKWNTFANRGSASYGRERLIDTLVNYRIWNELLELSQTIYLEPTDDEDRQDERLALVAMAGWMSGNESMARDAENELMTRRDQLDRRSSELSEWIGPTNGKIATILRPPRLPQPIGLSPDGKITISEPEEESSDRVESETSNDEVAETDSMSEEQKAHVRERNKIQRRLRKIKAHLASAAACRYAAQQQFAAALRESKNASRLLDEMIKWEWQPIAKRSSTLKMIEKKVKASPGDGLVLANAAYVAWKLEEHEQAKIYLEKAIPILANGDKETPLLERLRPLVEQLEFRSAWNAPLEVPSDVGDRPPLNELGPLRWSPPAAAHWTLADSQNKLRSSKEFQGTPRIMLFYLGFGCLHCVEQIKAFGPKVEPFREAGIEIVAISTESVDELQRGLNNFSESVPFPLLANPEHDVFRSYRCYDDFEGQPLHGTFVLDGDGAILWQDIGHEPFVDVEFLLAESRRLLQTRKRLTITEISSR